MTFALPVALLLALFIALPLWAHFRNRGKPQSLFFPGARFVAAATHRAKERRKVSDKWLLLLRTLLLLALVLLAASPVISIQRLGFARNGESSVALAVVLDDSASMNALVAGKSRFERAKSATLELIDSMRADDSMAIILAGSPARVAASPGQSRSELREIVRALPSSDRGTDLNQALELGKSSLTHLPHLQKSFIALSDRSVERLSPSAEQYSFPLAELTQPLSNCGITEALQTGKKQLEVEVNCNQSKALVDRVLEVYAAPQSSEGRAITASRAAVALAQTPAKEGRVSLNLESAPPSGRPLFVALTSAEPAAADQIKEDDALWVTQSASELRAGILADRRNAGTINKASSLLSVALKALEQPLIVEPLATLPAHREELKPFSLLIVDDPAGLTPEERQLVESWLKEGGVLAGFLGPALNNIPLGSSPEPFALSGATWEFYTPSAKDEAKMIARASTPLLDNLLLTWNPLRAQGRTLLPVGPGLKTRASFQDGRPLFTERTFGKGLVVTLALPSSPAQSDLSFRPAFIALLAQISKSVLERRGNLGGRVGQRLTGTAQPRSPEANLRATFNREGFEIHRAARVALEGPEGIFYRTFAPIREEMMLQPINISSKASTTLETTSSQPIEIPREIAWFALFLMLGELVLRVLKVTRRSPIPTP